MGGDRALSVTRRAAATVEMMLPAGGRPAVCHVENLLMSHISPARQAPPTIERRPGLSYADFSVLICNHDSVDSMPHTAVPSLFPALFSVDEAQGTPCR